MTARGTTPAACPTVWVALISDTHQGETVQVCTTRDAALSWVASTIPAQEWAEFYDHLPADERVGLVRDKDANDALTLLEGWAGDRDEDRDVWGNDMYLVTILEQTIYPGP